MLASKPDPLLASRVRVDDATMVSTPARNANAAALTRTIAMNTVQSVIRHRIVWPRSQLTQSTSIR
jgi:hypothetical protein